MRLKITYKDDSSKRALFEQPVQIIKPKGGSSQRTTSLTLESSSRSLKDVIGFERVLEYQEKVRKLLLILEKIKDKGVIERDHVFTYRVRDKKERKGMKFYII